MMLPPSSQTFSRLMSPSRNSQMWTIRKLIRRPLPGTSRNSPGTVPVVACSMTEKSSP